MGSTFSDTSAMPWPSLVRGLRAYATFTLDTEGVLESWNEGVRELLGYSEDEFIGQRGSIIFTLEDRAKGEPQAEMAVARAHGEATDDRWHLRKDGSRVYVNGIMRCVRGDDGAVLGFLKIMRDQTEKRAIDERLKESEERFAKAFRSSPSPVVVFELPGARIIDVNGALTRTFKLERLQTADLTLFEIGLAPEHVSLDKVIGELVRGESVRLEAPFRRGDGVMGYGMFAFEPIVLGGKPHAMMQMHDVTDWRRTQEQLEQQNQLVTAILDSLPGVFYMLDQGHLVRWNHELKRVTGLSAEELAVATLDDVAVEAEALRQNIDAAFRTGEAAIEAHLISKSGSPVPYLLTGRRVELGDDRLLLGIGVDISDQVRARRVLERQAREQAVLAELTAMSLSADALGKVLDFAAVRLAEVLGAEHVQIVEFEEDGAIVRAGFHGEDPQAESESVAAARFAENRDDLLSHDAGAWPAAELARLGYKSGIHARIHGRREPFGLIEALSEREGAFAVEDVRFLRGAAFLLAGDVEQRRLILELEHRADHDDLTGLLTRTAFERRLIDALERAKRQETMVGVLFLDLDRFKNVNDSLGHQAGDEVLRIVARRLREVVRSWDVIARHGGDEFVLFLPDVKSSSEVAHVTERVLEAFEEPFPVAGLDLTISTTVGVALFPENGEDADMLLRAADTALYEGKTRGRNSFHFFTREQNERVSERLALEADLRKAVDRGEFEMVYQPQVDLGDGTVRVVESLIRWRHPVRGALSPRDFLPVAEAIGLAIPVGGWILRQAFGAHATWRGRPGMPERIAINVSARYFLKPAFPRTLADIAQEAGIPPSEIEVEVSEATLLKDPELVTAHMRSVKKQGFGLVIDDLGERAAPLARLRSLPIDRLKIHEGLTHRLSDENERRLVEAIVQVALSLGIDPVAEGIETSEQHQDLRDLGFRAAQGRHYCKPLPRDEVTVFLLERDK